MTRYVLRSTWTVPGVTAEGLWRVLWDVETWPTWWPHLRSARLVRDVPGVGRRTALEYRAPTGYLLPLGLEVVTISPPDMVAARIVGALAGRGRWVLRPVDGGVVTDITIDVEPRKPWMRLLSPVAAPLFRAAHARVMADGERGLVAAVARGA